MQCTVSFSPETGGALVKPYQHSVSRYGRGPVWKDKIMEDEERRERRRRQREKVVGCCKKVAAFLFSHIGLAAMVVAYSIGGGFLFQALEAPYEAEEKIRILGERESAVEYILNEACELKLENDEAMGNFTNKVRAILIAYQNQVVSAVKDSGWDGNDDTDTKALQWSFAGALLYAVTVITTIGYGHVAPKTNTGRLVTILYALVGIPLTFLYLSNIGNFLADSFRLFYKKICCDICCCQKCERKKKMERLAMRRRRELAAQQNVSMNDPTQVMRYGAHDETLPIQDSAEYFVMENEQLGLPGGDENMGFEEDASESEEETAIDSSEALVPRQSPNADQSKIPLGNNVRDGLLLSPQSDIRETDILDDDFIDFTDNVRETAILGDDDDEEEERDKGPPSRKSSKKKNAHLTNSPASDIHVSSGILDKLGNARETDILDDSDDENHERQTQSPHPSQAKSLSDSELAESNKKDKKDMKRAKSLKDKSKSRFSKKDKTVKDKSRSNSAEPAVKDKGDIKRPSRKDKSKDGKSDRENKSNDKDLIRKGSRKDVPAKDIEEPPAYSSHSRSNSKKDADSGKAGKPSKKLFRKGTQKKDATDGAKGVQTKPSFKRKISKRRKKSESDSESEKDDQELKQKSFHQSEDSFVTAHGDSMSYMEKVASEADTEEETDEDEGFQSGPGLSKAMLSSDAAVTFDVDPEYDMEMMEFGDLGNPTPGQFADDPFDYEAHPDDEKVAVPISICLIIIAGYIFGGAVLFAFWEKWDYVSGSYFCFITLSTIGFGDIVPGTDMNEWSSHSKLISCSLWLAFGLSLLAMCFNLMQEEVKEKCKWLGRKLGLLKDDGEG